MPQEAQPGISPEWDVVFGIVGVILVVLGWVFTLWLTLWAQRRQFRIQVEDAARLSVTRGIREYQSWLYDYQQFVFRANLHLSNGVSIDWDTFFEDWYNYIESPRSKDWLERIKEYQVVFPKVADLIPVLTERHKHIYDGSLHLRSWMGPRALSSAGDAALLIGLGSLDYNPLIELNATVIEQRGIMQDLLVHLQNASLGKIMNRKIPMPSPVSNDEDLPRMTSRRDGKLSISGSTKNRKISPS